MSPNPSKRYRNRAQSAICSAVATTMLLGLLKKRDGMPGTGKVQKKRTGDVETEPLLGGKGDASESERMVDGYVRGGDSRCD